VLIYHKSEIEDKDEGLISRVILIMISYLENLPQLRRIYIFFVIGYSMLMILGINFRLSSGLFRRQPPPWYNNAMRMLSMTKIFSELFVIKIRW